LPSYRLIC